MADNFRPSELPPVRLLRGLRPVRFNWDVVIAMSQAGLFAETERVELTDGELSIPPEERPLHVLVLQTLQRWLYRNLGESYEPFIRSALRVSASNYLIPDISVLQTSFIPADCSVAKSELIVAVSVSTMKFDMAVKRKQYAFAGAKEFWIVDANARRILVHRQPSGDEFLWVQAFEAGQVAAPLCGDGEGFNTATLPNPVDFA